MGSTRPVKYVETMNTAKGARVDVESVQHIFYRTRQSPLAYLVLRDTIGLWGLWHVFLVGLASTARVDWKVAGLAHRDQLPMKKGRPAFHVQPAPTGRRGWPNASRVPQDISVVKETAQNA